MNSHFGSSLSKMNYQDRYGSSGWITNGNTLIPQTEYVLHPTINSTISGGRDYIALPKKTHITWQIKEKYNLR